MEKQQTAVDFLLEKITLFSENGGIYLTPFLKNEIVEFAKTMEKEQRKKDFIEGYKERALSSNLIFDETSELYARNLFNEKFKINT